MNIILSEWPWCDRELTFEKLMSREFWIPTLLSPDYEVSNFGRVRSVERVISIRYRCGRTENRRVAGRIMKPSGSAGKKNRPVVNILRIPREIGRLVISAFLGHPPSGRECCHNNGDPWSNRIDNLRYDTHLANMRDSVRHGTMPKGSRRVTAKLTEAKVSEMRRLWRGGVTTKELAEAHGVCYSVANRAIRGRTWRHVP